MKKKLLVVVLCLVCLISTLLAGCTPAIDVSNVEQNVIKVFQDAIAKSIEDSADTYFIKEREIDGDPKDIAKAKMTEYKFNYVADDKSIEGVVNNKAQLDVIHTKGIESYTDTFQFGQSLKNGVKDAKASDYKAYAFQTFKKTENAPKHTKDAREIDINSITSFETLNGIKINDFTMASVLAPLKELTAKDIKIDAKYKKENYKKGKVSYFGFEVTKEGHEYFNKGLIKVQIFEGKVMRVMTADEKYILDCMYQGPKMYTPNYDTFTESGVVISVVSDRTDGMIALYKDENYSEPILVNPEDLEGDKVLKLVEPAVNWNNTFTEVIYNGDHYFIATKNIVNNSFDINSLIPMAGLVVGLIALVVAIIAIFKLRKKNKLLTKRIDALAGVAQDVETEQAEEVADNEQVEEVSTEEASEELVENEASEEPVKEDVEE